MKRTMHAGRFDLAALTRDPDAVAAAAASSAVFGLLTRSLQVPPLWSALIIHGRGMSEVCRSGGELADPGAGEILFVRTAPVGLAYTFGRLLSADHFEISARLTVSVRPLAERSELAAFHERVMGGRRSLSRGGLADAFLRAVAGAVQAFIQQCPARGLVQAPDLDRLRQSVEAALAPRLFESGLGFEGVHDVSFNAPSFHQAELQQAELQRRSAHQEQLLALQHARAEADRRHVTHLQELLARLTALATEAPQTGLGDLLRTFEPGSRRELYQALWAAPAAPCTAAVAVACGAELLFYTPGDWGTIQRRLPVESQAGGLRSITAATDAGGRRVLLAGAARGVCMMDGAHHQVYLAPDGEGVRGGFNAACLAGEYLFATHSELGLLYWRRGRPHEPAALLAGRTAGARAVRHVQYREGLLWLSIDAEILALPPEPAIADLRPVRACVGSVAEISALAVTPKGVYAGNARGDVLAWPLEGGGVPARLHDGNNRAAESVSLLQDGGLDRLFYADTSSTLHALVLGDAFTCLYRAGGQTIRRAWIAADWTVAMNETRDRLLCWPTHQPQQAPFIVPVAQQAGHSIQDAALIGPSAADITGI